MKEASDEVNAAVEAELLWAKDNNLTCIKCQVDPTVSFEKQESVYTPIQLDEHLASNFHARREQLRRAFVINEGEDGLCECPCCQQGDENGYLQEAFLSHMESDHEAVMNFRAVCLGLCQSVSALELICKVLPEYGRKHS
jgi:hypothetical protein